MRLNEQGWLSGDKIRQLCSPNCHERAVDVVMDLLVVHGISLPAGEFGGSYIDRLFLNQINASDPELVRRHAFAKVSAHLLIDRHGQLTQYVSFDRCAWHAGISSFQGKERCNEYSIGIELEGTDVLPYTERQYQQLSKVAALLIDCYPGIVPDRIVGHHDIAPGRKTDPGPAFDWAYFKNLLSQVKRSEL